MLKSQEKTSQLVFVLKNYEKKMAFFCFFITEKQKN